MNQHLSYSHMTAVRPLLRSLLQKTVRRGYADLAQRTAFVLGSQGDSAWLQARTGVIVFEECWPSAHLLSSSLPSAVTLQQIAVSIKNKDAAGLGSLAHALAEGDMTALDQAYEQKTVKIVAAALKRPDDFFRWIRTQCQSDKQANVVAAARLFFNRASWPWDKAFLAAGAYLSIQTETKEALRSKQVPNEPFPYWTAIDKHTPQGKSALRKVATAARLSLEQFQWASFYFESAKSNEIGSCPWWECEAKWRLNKVGLSIEEAENMWRNNSDKVRSTLKDQAKDLCRMIEQANTESFLPIY
jgi:hypothetical protein